MKRLPPEIAERRLNEKYQSQQRRIDREFAREEAKLLKEQERIKKQEERIEQRLINLQARYDAQQERLEELRLIRLQRSIEKQERREARESRIKEIKRQKEADRLYIQIQEDREREEEFDNLFGKYFQLIRKMLDAAKECSVKYEVDVDVFMYDNPDETIDGDLHMSDLDASNRPLRTLLTAVSKCFRPLPNTWISIGLKFEPEKDITTDSLDEYHETFTYPQKNTRKRLPIVFETAKFILDKMKTKGFRSLEKIIVWVYFSKTGKQPPRR